MADEQNLIELMQSFRRQLAIDGPAVYEPEAIVLAAMVHYEIGSKIERQLARIAEALENQPGLDNLNQNLHSLLTYGIRANT